MTDYPNVRRDPNTFVQVEDTKIPDPYQWLENLESDETKQFIEAQYNYGQKYLPFEGNNKVQSKIEKTVSQFWFYSKRISLQKHGNWYYFLCNHGKDNYQDLILKKYTLFFDDPPENVFNPNYKYNTNFNNGYYILMKYSFSWNGKFIALVLKSNQHDTTIISILDVEHRQVILNRTDEIILRKGFHKTDIAWTINNKGFFYINKLSQQNENNKWIIKFEIYYHRIGTSQKDDIKCVIIEPKGNEKYCLFSLCITHCGRYLLYFITSSLYFGHNLWFVKLYDHYEDPDKGIFKNSLFQTWQIIYKWDSRYKYVVNYGRKVLFISDKNADMSNIIQIDFWNPKPKCHCNWRMIVPEQKTMCLIDAKPAACGAVLILHYVLRKKPGGSCLCSYSVKKSRFLDTQINPCGAIRDFHCRLEDYIVFFTLESIHHPGKVYRYKIKKEFNDCDDWWFPSLPYHKNLGEVCEEEESDDSDYEFETLEKNLQEPQYDIIKYFHNWKMRNDENKNDIEEIIVKEGVRKRYRIKNRLLKISTNMIDEYDPEEYITKSYFLDSKNPRNLHCTTIAMKKVHEKLTGDAKIKKICLKLEGACGLISLPLFDPFLGAYMVLFDSYAGLTTVRGSGSEGKERRLAGMKTGKSSELTHEMATLYYSLKIWGLTKEGWVVFTSTKHHAASAAYIFENHPNYFFASIFTYGVFDLLRHNLYEDGQFWSSEYGDLNDEEDAEFLSKWSLCHNVVHSERYYHTPALIIVNEKDSNISPFHSYKYLAELQYVAGSKRQEKFYFLLRIERNSESNQEYFTYLKNSDEKKFFFLTNFMPLGIE